MDSVLWELATGVMAALLVALVLAAPEAPPGAALEDDATRH
jgi:hypothetical protein